MERKQGLVWNGKEKEVRNNTYKRMRKRESMIMERR